MFHGEEFLKTNCQCIICIYGVKILWELSFWKFLLPWLLKFEWYCSRESFFSFRCLTRISFLKILGYFIHFLTMGKRTSCLLTTLDNQLCSLYNISIISLRGLFRTLSKMPHHRCLTGLWIRLSPNYLDFCDL